MEVSFDSEITTADLQAVNCLRYWMNVAMCTNEDQVTPDAGPRDIVRCQTQIKKILFE